MCVYIQLKSYRIGPEQVVETWNHPYISSSSLATPDPVSLHLSLRELSIFLEENQDRLIYIAHFIHNGNSKCFT